MHAASREAFANTTDALTSAIGGANVDAVAAARTGAELFDIVDTLDADRSLRLAVANPASDQFQREGLVSTIFGSRVSQETLQVLKAAAGNSWSNARDFRTGLVDLARQALLRSAQATGQLERVENELFQLAQTLISHPDLEQLLGDRTASAERKRGLLASVLYGKVTAVTEALALQAISRPSKAPADDIEALSAAAAGVRGKSVAKVTSATALSPEQVNAVQAKLSEIYSRDITIQEQIDSSLLGGFVVHIGNEVIDGSTRGKIARLRAGLR